MVTSIVVLKLRQYEDPKMAEAVWGDILESGEIRYTKADGTTETAFITSASIEEREPSIP